MLAIVIVIVVLVLLVGIFKRSAAIEPAALGSLRVARTAGRRLSVMPRPALGARTISSAHRGGHLCGSVCGRSHRMTSDDAGNHARYFW
jgi:hypothetical protein